MLLAKPYAAENACCILRVRLNSRKLIHFKIAKQLFNLVVKTYFFDASAAVGQKNPFAERPEDIRKLQNGVLSEDKLSRSTINKIFHNSTHLSNNYSKSAKISRSSSMTSLGSIPVFEYLSARTSAQ